MAIDRQEQARRDAADARRFAFERARGRAASYFDPDPFIRARLKTCRRYEAPVVCFKTVRQSRDDDSKTAIPNLYESCFAHKPLDYQLSKTTRPVSGGLYGFDDLMYALQFGSTYAYTGGLFVLACVGVIDFRIPAVIVPGVDQELALQIIQKVIETGSCVTGVQFVGAPEGTVMLSSVTPIKVVYDFNNDYKRDWGA